MGKFLKVLGGLILALVLLVAAAAVILPMVIDPNDYKDEVITQVKQHTGRDLKIAGDLELSVFPWLGVGVGGVELSNAEGFGDKPFAAIESAAIRVKLMPLLSRQLVVDTIGLNGMQLNLARSKSGQNNWDDLMAVAGATAGKEASPNETREKGLEGFEIGGVNISDASVSWDDKSTGQHFAVDQFSLKSGAIRPGDPVDLEMGARLVSKQPELTAQVELQTRVSLDQSAGQLSLSGFELQLDASGPQFKQGPMKASFKADIAMALTGESLSIDGLMLTADSLQLSGQLKGRQLTSQPALNGELKLAEFNLREFLDRQGMVLPDTADPQVLTRFGASLALASQGAATQLNDLQVALDDTRIDGKASIKGERIGFELNLDRIDLDRYLPPKPDKGAAKADQGAKMTGDEPLLPVETLRALNMNGSLSIGEMVINKLTAKQIQLKIKANGGRLDLDSQIGAFYEGRLKGGVALDVAGSTPQMRVNESLTAIQAGPLLKDLLQKDKFEGKGDFQADLRASGNSLNAIKRTLNGDLSFRFENGAVKGFNLAQMIRQGQARLKGESAASDNDLAQTDFSEMSGSAVVRKGLVDNRDLLAKSPYLRVTGAGKINLVTETLDYLVKPVIVGTSKGQGGAELEKLKGVPIPVKLTGPYTEPKFSIDWGQVVTETQKAKVEEKKQEVKQKLQDKLQDKLRGLFN